MFGKLTSGMRLVGYTMVLFAAARSGEALVVVGYALLALEAGAVALQYLKSDGASRSSIEE